MTTKIETAAERYRRKVRELPPETAEVTPPSGLAIKFIKPSKFRMIFEYGQMPQSATAGAIDQWVEQGVLKPGEIDNDTAGKAEAMIKLVERVLELSYEPKIVKGPASNKNEISASEIPDGDMTYFCAWVASGGVVSVPLGNFPEGPDANAVSGNGRTKRRGKGK